MYDLRRTLALPVSLVALGAAAELGLCGCSRAPLDPVERAVRAISVDRIEEHGRRLAADEMGGRYYASPEADSAAAYLVRRLRAARIPLVQRAENLLGSHPASFAHHFTVTLYRLGEASRLEARHAGNERLAQLGHDFVPLVFARTGEAEGTVAWIDGRVDLLPVAGRPLAGRVAVVGPSGLSRRPGGSLEAALVRAARRLEEAGAAAVLFAADAALLQSAAATYPTHLAPEQRAALASVRGTVANLHADRVSLAAQAVAWKEAPRRILPAVVVRRSWADRLQTGDRVRLVVDLKPEVSLGQNVLVGFRGTTRPDDVVVLTASYDHLGINAAGDVLNGADDNASGVVALLEVAAALLQVHDRLDRSVLVVFLSASRQGPQGAEALLHDLPQLVGGDVRPVAMLSLRAIGRNDTQPLLLLGGRERPDLAAVLERFDRAELLLGPALKLRRAAEETTAPAALEVLPSRGSSHLAFARAGVPTLLLTDGLDPLQWGQPEDDWKTVDADKVARVARLAFLAAHALATGQPAAASPASAAAK